MDPIQEIHLKTERTARLATLGTPGPLIRECWLVIHGYRMLARRFIRPFECLAGENTLIVAPEALSRFYLGTDLTKHREAKVGASWMTREDRLAEIADQQYYLDRVWSHFQNQLAPDTQFHLLGFSQGTATLWRWLQHSRPEAASITFWCGGIPQEFTPEMDEYLSAQKLCYVFASDDEFISLERGKMQGKLFKNRYPNMQELLFEGKHEVKAEALLKLREML